ncbi:mechanosensitive ion channel family protein [Kaarinaea lacus]
MDSLMNYVNELVQPYAGPTIKTGLAVLLAIVIYFIFCRAVKKIGASGYFDYHLSIILSNVVKWFLVAVVILLSLGFFGVSVGTLWAALSGVLALVALGFVAVWSVLSNVLCSVLLIIFPPFRIGDEIEIQEPTANFSVRGKVVSINMLMTSLEISDDATPDMKGNLMRVPNNIFFQKYVRCIPGKGTQSLQKFMAQQQETE